MDRIVLAYERTEHTFKGYFDFVDDDDEKNNCRDTFEDWTFRQMLKKLIEEARADSAATLLFMRLEQKPFPMAVELEPKLVDLIHTDPLTFLRHMDPVYEIGVRDIVPKDGTKHLGPQPIPSGYNTLADAFGDSMYCRMKRGGPVECPVCGRWGVGVGRGHEAGLFKCEKCGLKAPGVPIPTSSGGWFTILTSQLLLLAQLAEIKRLFLPRGWNKTGPWVSTEDLREKYKNFCEERYQWTQVQTPTDDTSE